MKKSLYESPKLLLHAVKVECGFAISSGEGQLEGIYGEVEGDW